MAWRSYYKQHRAGPAFAAARPPMLDWPALPQAPASLQLTLLLGFLIALVALGIDSTVPALPAVAIALGSAPGAAQLTLTGLFAGVACGQLAWGPLSDRYGRRPTLYGGLALMALASLASALAADVATLAWLRFAQGIGLSCGPVIGRSIVRDLYSHEQAARLLSRMTIVFGFVPVFAPLAGSALLDAAGWQAVFWLHAAIALALVTASGRVLAETAPRRRAIESPLAMALGYARLLGQRAFLAPFLVMLGVQLGIIAFVTNSAVTLIRGFGLTPYQYSFVFALVMLGQIGGAFAGSRLVTRHGVRAMLRLGAAFAACAGIAVAALAWIDVRHWAAVALPMCAYLFAASLVIPNATAAALQPFPERAGSASSLMGALAFGVGALLGAVLGWSFDGSARPMASAAALGGAAAWLAIGLLPPQTAQAHGPR
ncbi:MAG: Bcr/CflA family efflux MFS transporter [Betaproteobacteria bacterium]|nr:MAG: Bcr/CflA family efflux MFS transporter [Betaproteobacteria bacterium]